MENENCSILSVKVLKDGVSINYHDGNIDRNIIVEDKNMPHPDLYNAIQGFNEYLAKVHYVPREKTKSVAATGFSIKTDTIVVLKGTLTVPSEKKIAINSDAIDLSKTAYGFEDDLQTVIDIVTKETKLYLFDGKATQGKIEFNQEEKTDPK